MNFTGYLPQQNPQLFPQQQIVVPPITIPQGFAPKYIENAAAVKGMLGVYKS